MEKKYEMTIELGGYRKNKEDKIIKACQVEWRFRDDDFALIDSQIDNQRLLQASVIGCTYEGEQIGEIIERIKRAVWRANNGMCHVECHASLLSEVGGIPSLIPCEPLEAATFGGFAS